MLHHGVSHENLDIIRLRLDNIQHPLPLHHKIIALNYAKDKEKIRNLLISPNDPLACFPDYTPSFPGIAYDFNTITTNKEPMKKPLEQPLLEGLEDVIISKLRYWKFP